MGKIAVLLCAVLIVCLAACGGDSETVLDSSPAGAANIKATAANTPVPPSSTTERPTDTPLPPTSTAEPPTDTPVPPTPNAMQAAMTEQALTQEPPSAESSDAEDIAIASDILYAVAVEPDAQDQYLDVYAPESPGEYPVLLWAHGIYGDKSDARTLGRILAKEGIVTVVPTFRSYDLLDEYEDSDQEIAVLREVLEEAECALRFVSGQIESYAGDPDQVIWGGYSYGGWLGTLMALGEGDLQSLWDAYAGAKDGPPKQVDCAEQAEPVGLQAFVGNGTVVFSDFWFGTEIGDDPTALVPELREYAAIGHNPTLKVRLIYGKYDMYDHIVVEGSQNFEATLAEQGYDVEIYPQDGQHNTFWDQVIEQVLNLVGDASSSSMNTAASCGSVEGICLAFSFDGENCTYEGPANFKNGPTTLIFLNEGEESASLGYGRHREGETVQDMIEYVETYLTVFDSPSPMPIPDWWQHQISVPVFPGSRITWEVYLLPGIHTFICFDGAPLYQYFGTGIVVED